MKRMLFNATHAEELRVSIVDGQKLIDIDIESSSRQQRKSNIYKGIVTRIEPSLEACFVDYGEERHGFLPFKEISRAYFNEGVEVKTATIKEAISEGTELIVQVEKEERGNKGAALTTFISLAGRYLVLMPNNPRGGGVSRRIEGEERQELKETMAKLPTPRGMSLIARTAGIGRSVEELQWDLDYLLKLWEAISDAATPQYQTRSGQYVSNPTPQELPNLKRANPAPFLIVEESNLVIRAIRDYFQPEIGEILIDTQDIYEQAKQFMGHVMPDMVNRVKLYTDDVPLFSRFQIENQIETAYSRTVPLPSGGAIVIDHTEALVAIDVNSAKATKGVDIEETAFRTNIEAADEVARQMRLRDLGGLIVIDFIDMLEPKNQRAIELRMKEAIHYDRARVQAAKISRFGLMELSRQRLRPSLYEGSHISCPRCNGVGVIRDTESSAIQILRILQEEALKGGTCGLQAQVPVDVATFLLNEKRTEIAQIEARHKVEVILIPNKTLETPHYQIERLKTEEDCLEDGTPSYERVEELDTASDEPYSRAQNPQHTDKPRQVPVIKGLPPREDAPQHVEKTKQSKAKKAVAKTSLWQKIVSFFTGEEAAPARKPKKDKKQNTRQRKEGNDKRNRRQERSDREDNRNLKKKEVQKRERTSKVEQDRQIQTKETKERKEIKSPAENTREVVEKTTRRSRNPRKNNSSMAAQNFPQEPFAETFTDQEMVKSEPVSIAHESTNAVSEPHHDYPLETKRNSYLVPVEDNIEKAEVAPIETSSQEPEARTQEESEPVDINRPLSQEALATEAEVKSRRRRTLRRDKYGRGDRQRNDTRNSTKDFVENSELLAQGSFNETEVPGAVEVKEEIPSGLSQPKPSVDKALESEVIEQGKISLTEAPQSQQQPAAVPVESSAPVAKPRRTYKRKDSLDLQPMLKEAGLELVGTKPIQTPVEEVEQTKVKLGRKRTKRSLSDSSEPLELVQTKQ